MFKPAIGTPNWALLTVCLLAVAQVAVVLPYAITLHYTFKTSAYDIGIFEQMLFNFIHGRGLTVTFSPPGIAQSWLAIHFSPILYLLVPFYWLWPDEIMLRVINPLLLASAAVPLFFLIRQVTQHQLLAVVFAACYLINPFVVNGAVWDFHEVAFAPLLFLLCYLALINKRRGWFILCCLLLITVKEHYGLAVAGFGALWAWHHKEWRFGGAVIGLGVLIFALIIGVIIPALGPLGGHYQLVTEENDRFSWLFRPLDDLAFLQTLVADDLWYLFLLGLGWLFLPYIALVWLLPGAADISINLLSAHNFMRFVGSYHSGTLVAVFSVATAYATLTLIRKQWLDVKDTVIGLLVVSVGLHYYAVVLPYGYSNFWEFQHKQLSLAPEDQRAMQDIRALIPKQEAIAAQNNVGAHFGDWPEIYHFPPKVEPASWLLLRLDFPYQQRVDVLGSPFSVSCGKYLESVVQYLNNHEWKVAYWNAPWLVLQHKGSEVIRTRAPIQEAAHNILDKCNSALAKEDGNS